MRPRLTTLVLGWLVSALVTAAVNAQEPRSATDAGDLVGEAARSFARDRGIPKAEAVVRVARGGYYHPSEWERFWMAPELDLARRLCHSTTPLQSRTLTPDGPLPWSPLSRTELFAPATHGPCPEPGWSARYFAAPTSEVAVEAIHRLAAAQRAYGRRRIPLTCVKGNWPFIDPCLDPARRFRAFTVTRLDSVEERGDDLLLTFSPETTTPTADGRSAQWTLYLADKDLTITAVFIGAP